MLERLTETFIAGVELLEAEGRVARDRLVALAGALLVLIACGIVALVGLLAAAVGLTWLLALAIGAGGALAIVGSVLLAASLLVARVAVLRLHRPGPAATAPPPPQPPVPATDNDRADHDQTESHDDHLPVPTSPAKHAAPFTTDEALPAALTRNPPP